MREMEEREMDPSKLPNSPPPTQPHIPHHPTPQELSTPPKTNVHHYGSPLPGGFIPAEAWMSFVIGVIVLFMFPTFGQYVVMHNHLDDFYAKPNNTFYKNGQSIPFEQSPLFYPDMGLTVFGVVLILDALVLLRSRLVVVLWIALALTTLCVLLNIFAIIKAYDDGGFMLFNALAVAFGGYMALYDWRLIQTLSFS
jgi:hypothetical protein